MKDCGNCKWFCPEQPKDWTPPPYGGAWSKMELVIMLEEAGRVVTAAGWPGACQVGPVPAPVRSGYVCASWRVDDQTWGMLLDINGLITMRSYPGEIEKLRKSLRDEKKRSCERFRKLKGLRAQAKVHTQQTHSPPKSTGGMNPRLGNASGTP